MTDSQKVTLEPMAWIALVARWAELARASRALPTSDERLRASIAPIITIEANTAALAEIASIPEEHRAHARTLAEISIRGAAHELDLLWRGEEWPEEFFQACDAAECALRNALYAGLEAIVVTSDQPIEVPLLEFHLTETEADASGARSMRGTLAAMPPGSLAMPGEPICWWTGRPAPSLQPDSCDVSQPHSSTEIARQERTLRSDLTLRSGLALQSAALPLQVYRGLDERGRFTHDTLVPITEELLPGLPMLVPILIDGVRVGRFLHERDRWREMQRAAMGSRTALDVIRSIGT